jgi:general secretion pathway protein E
VKQLEPGLKLEDQVKEYLEKQGYQVTERAKLQGKSGVEHTFDMLAQKDDGFIIYAIAIGIINVTDREVELTTAFNLANKAYDTGIRDKALIAVNELSQEAKEFAQKQRIKVFDGKQMGALLTLTPSQPAKPDVPFQFETKPQLLESLANLGYRVEEKAKVQGRSGVEYTFDILAYSDYGHMGHSLGIDIISSGEEIGLGQVTLFDTKGYDVGIDYKAIVVSPRLSPEATQFAQLQRIKVLELGQKPFSEFLTIPQKPALLEEKPTKLGKAEVLPDKTKAKPLRLSPQPEALQLIPEVMARRYNAIPLTISGNTLHVAMADPADIFALEAFAAQSHMRIKPVAASSKETRDAIDLNYKGYGEIEKQISGISISSELTDERVAIDAAVDAPLVKALNLIIDEAVKARSSDIHLEPEESRLRVRYRIDGTLQDMISLPLNIHSALISRIKILADMNIADHHRPQDGQFSTEAKGRLIDVRVSTAPTVHGEMSVLRLLDKSLALLELSELGFLPDSLAKYEAMLKVPYGMILISGPTGAGKTTTLYASINSLDMIGANIVTIEDPAEYRFKDINQIQVNPQAGITFASGLRSILRLDPDVIMVGEIRDAETANIAIQAALTGHLMPSSIHANDATGVLFRLLDLKVEPFLVASAVIGMVAQRMVRRICPDCSHLIEVPLVEQMAYEQEMGEKRAEFLYGTGCKSCSYTGYQGRTGIFEILTMSDAIRMMLTRNANTSDIRAQALKEGMTSMMNDGMRKVKAGITTPSEVLRVTYSPV